MNTRVGNSFGIDQERLDQLRYLLRLREERNRTAKALIAGGATIGWTICAIYLTLSASAWIFAFIAAAILLGAIVKTISVYRKF